MRALHRRGPRKGAPTEAKRRTAAYSRCCAARRALQHRMRDRAAVPERRHAAHRPGAAAVRLHLVRVRVRTGVKASAKATATVKVRAISARLRLLCAQRRRRILPQLAHERV
eukprot:scaffold1042_cov64-Phaeocystis_antarctica.AAC.1